MRFFVTRIFTLLLACLGIVTSLPSLQADETPRPNFVFFLVDDIGWADVGCFGSTFNETPHIDALAASGMKFTS